MKNKKTYLVLLCLVLLTVCLCLSFFFVAPSSNLGETSSRDTTGNVSLEESPGESAPTDFDPMVVWEKAERVLAQSGAFGAKTTGYVDTQVLFFNYRQMLSGRRVVSDDVYFFEWTSSGSLLNSGLQAYCSGQHNLIRTGTFLDKQTSFWSDAPYLVSDSVYATSMGNKRVSLSHYEITEANTLSSSFESTSDGRYIFSFRVGEGAFASYALALQTLNAFEDAPVFESAEIILEVDRNFRPLSVSYDEKYSIKMNLIGYTSCAASYKETFLYDEIDLTDEKNYFGGFVDLAESTFPSLSGGYDLLFSLFGNNRSYNLDLTVDNQPMQFHVNFDSSAGVVHLQGDELSLLYTDERYYFAYEDIRVFTTAQSFDEQFLPLSVLSDQVSRERNDNQFASLLKNVSVSIENGKIILRSEETGYVFLIVIESSTMTIQKLEFSTDFLGQRIFVDMEVSPVRGTIPDLNSYRDISSSMSAFSMIGDLSKKGSTYYKVLLDAEVSYEGDVILTIGDRVYASVLSSNDELPLNFYFDGEEVTVEYMQAQAQGTLDELVDLFDLLSNTPATYSKSNVPTKKAELIAEEGKITLFMDGNTYVFEDDVIRCCSDDFSLDLVKCDSGSDDALDTPESDCIVLFSDLSDFFDGSYYPEMLNAGTVFFELVIFYDGVDYPATGCLVLDKSISLGISANIDGQPLGVIWAENTLYISHPLGDMFVPKEHIGEILPLMQSLSGDSTEYSLDTRYTDANDISMCCDGNEFRLAFGAYEIVLYKDSFCVTSEDVVISGGDFTCSTQTTQIVIPDKNTCIDVYELLLRLQEVANYDMHSFVGMVEYDGITATINSLCLDFDDAGLLREFLLELSMHNDNRSNHRIYYDGEFIYIDANETKMFAWAEQLLPALETLFASETRAVTVEPTLIDLSSLKSIEYYNDTLSIVTNDGTLILSWKNDQPQEIAIYTDAFDINLLFAEPKTLVAPSPEGYVDISSVGGLIAAIANTVETGSFAYEGSIDLQFLSVALLGVDINGAASYADGELMMHMLVDVPYVYSVTSKGVPFLSGMNPLLQCRINSEIFLVDDIVYVRKTIVSKYGLFEFINVELIEERYLALEDFFASPYELLAFALNLEENTMADTPEPVARDRVILNPLKKFSSDGNVYVTEFYPQAIFPTADEILVTFETDGTYLTDVAVKLSASVVSIVGQVNVREYGEADVFIPDQIYLSRFLPLHE